MRFYFYSLTEQPTAHRLEPSLDEVFHDPETYRKYIKPMMAVELSDIVPGMSGEISIPARSSCTCLSGMATGSCI